jgi:D-tyrosyl-tRNA(Tyr) deacylase
MRAVVQRASEAWVRVDGAEVGRIGQGLLILLGVGREDRDVDADQLAEKVVNLRIFADDAGHMNRSLLDVRGELLVVSQFTLYGDARKGRRPSFVDAAPPAEAERLYRRFIAQAGASGPRIATGVFQAMMEVGLVNDGPVTILLDSGRAF